MKKREYITFPYHTIFCVYLLSVFLTLPLLLNFCVERVPAPWCSQQTKETDRNIIHNDYRILIDMATICSFFFLRFQSSILKFFSVQEFVHLDFSLTILCFMNSLVNPIVYTIRMPEFRKALLVLFKRQRRQNARDIPLHAL